MRRYIQAPRTTEEHINSAATRIEKLERRLQIGGLTVYVQPDEPLDVPIGTLWFDTDEPV